MKPNLERAVDGILDSYRDLGGINHLEGPNLPSQQSVARIVEDLESLVFPGFRAEENLDLAGLRWTIGAKVAAVFRALSTEVERSLRYTCRIVKDCTRHEDCRGEAEELVHELLCRIPEIRRRVSRDVEAANRGDPAARSSEEVILAYPGVEAIMVHRIAHELWVAEVAMIPRMMSEYLHGKTGIDIHPGAQIGRRFFIDHGTGVVIGETCEIGENVRIYQGVTLGAFSPRRGQRIRGTKRHPTIEDDVTIYAGATILGGETVIGRCSVISGNTTVTESVPPNSRVVPEPPRQEVRRGDTDCSPDQLHWDI
jgi:serine O-acetyltransferase